MCIEYLQMSQSEYSYATLSPLFYLDYGLLALA